MIGDPLKIKNKMFLKSLVASLGDGNRCLGKDQILISCIAAKYYDQFTIIDKGAKNNIQHNAKMLF